MADQVVWLGCGARCRPSSIAPRGSSFSTVDLSSKSSYGRCEPTASVAKLIIGQEITVTLEEGKMNALKEGAFCYH